MCVCVCVFLKGKTGDEGGGVRFTSLEERNWEFLQSSREIGESWKVLKCHCGENSVQLQDCGVCSPYCIKSLVNSRGCGNRTCKQTPISWENPSETQPRDG